MSIGPMEWVIIALVALLLFGAGRIADIGKGLGQGIKNFKQGLKEASDDGDGDEDEAETKKAAAAKKAAKAEKAKKEEAAEEA